MITNACEVLKERSLPPALWLQAVCHAVWIKNRTPTQSLNSTTTPYQSYFGKKPSLSSLRLFGCKAYAHVPKVHQTKLGKCSIECIHIGFADDKKAYVLYSQEWRQLIKSWDVEFEEVEDRERERVNVDPDDNTNLEDSEGEDDTSNPQRVNIPDPDPNSLSSDHTPPPLHHSTCTTRGIPHT